MARLYLVIIVLGVLGGVGYGAWQYYNDTQQRIQPGRKQCKVRNCTGNKRKSINAMREQAAQTAVLTKKLQEDLQKAEQYGDNLRTRLRQLDLLADAIADAKNLEGRMNGATAKLWRETWRNW